MGRSQSRAVVGYGKEKAERKDEAMIARFDYRPLLTVVLALTTAVLMEALSMRHMIMLVVVALVMAAIMLATGMPAYAGGDTWGG